MPLAGWGCARGPMSDVWGGAELGGRVYIEVQYIMGNGQMNRQT